MRGKLLIIDDEEAVRFFIAAGLTQAGWSVAEADSGEAGLALLEAAAYDVVLLDLRMPGMDGVTVMQQIKARWPETMVVIMTAYASLESAIEAVRQGAYDYLRKPCDVKEILTTVEGALQQHQEQARRSQALQQLEITPPPPDVSPGVVRSGRLVINLGAHTASLAGQPISLTPTEFELLALLAQTPGRAVSLDRLVRIGLGYDHPDAQAAENLRVHISRLRRKLGGEYILTVRGGGYALAGLPPADLP